MLLVLLLLAASVAASEPGPESARERPTGVTFTPQNGVSVFGKMVDPEERKTEEKTPSVRERESDEGEHERNSTVENEDESLSFLSVERSLGNVTRASGESVRLRCEARGRPAPRFRWFKNEAPLETERGRLEVRRYGGRGGRVGSRLRIADLDIHDTGYYRCEADNGRHQAETTGILVVKAGRMHSSSLIPNFPPPLPHFPALGGRLPDFEQSELGFCQPYRGAACAHLIGNRTIYVKASAALVQREEQLTAVLSLLAVGQETSAECRRHATPFLCLSAFPPCDEAAPFPVPRHVCRRDCAALDASACGAHLRRHPLVQRHELLPECEELPSAASCVALAVPQTVHVDPEETCYRGRGESYRGASSRTASSQPCQPWSPVAEYEELSGGHSYCRNPGALDAQPWCFVADPQVRREPCDVPRCADHRWLYVAVPSAASTVAVALLLLLWRRSRKPAKLSPRGPTVRLVPTHHQLQASDTALRLPVGVPQVSPQSVRFLHELGDGVYGKVFRGELQSSPVAIKTLREGGPRRDFCREAETVAALQHPNVVCLVAVCAEPLGMLFEYMFQCDLHEFLLAHSPHCDAADRDRLLELPDFLAIAMQVAAGMEYLSTKRYVHRDLAARNCLVSAESAPKSLSQTCLARHSPLADQLLVKISDLGVSRHSCASEYFRVRNALLPVRWMAPESLLCGLFSPESDVWSFGVLLWEIFSRGLRPYFDRDHQEVIDLVCGHQRLPRPDDCPPHVYAVMNDCWHDSPSHRPNFKEIYNRLCSVQTLHERTFSVSHSVLTHDSSSHPSSNKTLSTNLSCGSQLLGSVMALRQNNVFPLCPGSMPFAAGHRTHQCEQV